MPLDPSISLHAGDGVQQNPLLSDPIGTFGKVVGIQNALNTNRLFPLIQQQHENQVQLGQTAIDTNQLALARQRLGAASDMMMSALFDPNTGKPVPSIDAGEITRRMSDMVSGGIIPADFAAKQLATLPNGGTDPVANKNWALQHWAANNAARGHLDQVIAALSGTPADINNGQQIQPGVRAGTLTGAAGEIQPRGAATQTYPSRTDLLTQQPDIGANNEPTAEPLGARAARQGAGALTGPAGRSLFPNPVRQPPQNGAGAGAGISAPTPPPATAAPGAQPTPGAGAFAVPVGLPPGEAAAMQASGEQLATDRRAASGYAQRVFPLQQAATALASTNTGPGTDTVNHIKSFLLAQSPDALQKYLPGVDPSKIQSYDEAKKYLAQYALNQPGANRSDMALLQSDISNPSTAISNAAARHIVTNLIGLERMQVAAVNSYQGAPAGYARYRANFATQYDPRGFAWDQMTPAEQSKLVRGMSDVQLTRLHKAKLLSEQMGLTDTGATNVR